MQNWFGDKLKLTSENRNSDTLRSEWKTQSETEGM